MNDAQTDTRSDIQPEPTAEPKTEATPAEPGTPQVAHVPAARPAAPPRRRWLVLGASAILSSVAAQNYVCYSRPSAGAPPEEPAALTCDITLEDAGHQPRWQQIAAQLKPLEVSERQVMWSGYDVLRRLQVIWIWDFYRIQSHVALRVMLPPEGAEEVNPTWQQALDGLRAARPGDTLRVSVQSSCGDIFQVHTVQAPAQEWTPGAADLTP